MPRDFSMDSVGDMLDGLKSRLGFTRNDDYEKDDYDDYDYNEYDDYDDDRNEDAGFRPVSSSSPRASSYGRADSFPNLVSFDDVKASTTVPDRLRRDPLASNDRTEQSLVGGHYVIDATAPAPSSPAYKAAQRDAANKVGAFTPPIASTTAAMPSATTRSYAATSAPASYDPYEAYSTTTPSTHTPTRTLTVVKPMSYGDVERVARAVKSGDVVVLSMHNTPDDLSKRILDFSFGVASALDANVECPGNKVFAIARGNALTEDEKRRLRAQAVL